MSDVKVKQRDSQTQTSPSLSGVSATSLSIAPDLKLASAISSAPVVSTMTSKGSPFGIHLIPGRRTQMDDTYQAVTSLNGDSQKAFYGTWTAVEIM